MNKNNPRQCFSTRRSHLFIGIWLAVTAAMVLTAPTASGATTEFTSTGGIVINDNANATPYPSTIMVSGVTGIVTSVRVKINGFTHTIPGHVDVFLVSPVGQVCTILSDAGYDYSVSNVNLVFDDTAGRVIPDYNRLLSGTYRPANYETEESLPPGGTGNIGTSLSALNAGVVNGAWKLFVTDDMIGHSGSLTSWAVVIETVIPGPEIVIEKPLGMPLITRRSAIAWGMNDFGQTTVPPGLDGVNAIAAGSYHTVILKSDGSVVAWGNNDAGQTTVPAGLNGVSAIAAGVYHTVALQTDGTVMAWGNNSFGQTMVPIGLNGISAIASGADHTVALKTDGTVVAWGSHNFGQINVPAGLGGVSAIAAGDSHTLALKTDGTVVAWGNNNYGQTTVPTGLAGVSAIAAGDFHSLALKTDGTVVAWGNNNYGQRTVPAGLAGVSAIAAGDFHSVALKTDGTVVAWGKNDYGQATVPAGLNGASLIAAGGNHTATFARNDRFTFSDDQEVGTSSLGKIFTIKNTGTAPLSIFSANTTGDSSQDFIVGTSGLAPSVLPGAQTTFTVVFHPTSPGIRTAILHVVSDDADEAIADITLTGTGAPAWPSTLAATYQTASDIPVTASGYTAAGKSAVFSLNYAPLVGTTLMVVKNTAVGFITGNFDNLAQGQAVALEYLGVTYNFVADYFGGTGNDLVLRWAATRLFAWGGNYHGQLGNNLTTRSRVPVAVNASGELAGKTVVSGAASFDCSIALCSDGKVLAWGDNWYGQLGNNSTIASHVPMAVDTTAGVSALFGKTVVAVAKGGYFCLALCSDGTVVSWGINDRGQLGNNSVTDSHVPVAVNTTAGVSSLYGKTVVGIAAGYSHCLAACSDGTVSAWGGNEYGQLGNNSTADSQIPVAVSMDSALSSLAGKTVVAVSTGNDHSMALCSDGKVVTWGKNGSGQLGINSFVNSSLVPVAVIDSGVLSGKEIASISAGASHSLAICSDGTAVSWGSNGNGQLGSSAVLSVSYSYVPVAVEHSGILSGKTVVAIGAGSHHSLAICSDSSLVAWGSNSEGQLGNNSSLNSKLPIAVHADLLAPGERFIATMAGATADISLGIAGIHSTPGSGSLSMLLTPVDAVLAGAKWRVDGGAWQDSGATVGSLNAGSHVISFYAPEDYFELNDQTVMVDAGQTLSHAATYVGDWPVMVVEEPTGVVLGNGSGSVDFGSVFPGSTVVRLFTLRNTGTRELDQISLAIDGANASDFTISKQPKSWVVPGGSTTLAVEFSPKSAGPRTSILRVLSNDFAHPSFDITLTGSGIPGDAPLNTWQWRNRLPQGNDLNGIAYANGLFVAVGDAATIMTSPDGINWTRQTSPKYAQLFDVSYGNGLFMAVGARGTVLTSTDAVNWNDRSIPSEYFYEYANLHAVAFGGGRFAIVGGDAISLFDVILSTTDGMAWSGGHVDNPRGSWIDITYGNGRFVAVGNGGVTTTSSTGLWFENPRYVGTEVILNGITFGNGRFVAVGTYTLANDTSISMTSSDGANWSVHPFPRVDFGSTWTTGICFGNGMFVTEVPWYDETSDGTFLTSPDGVAWTAQQSIGPLESLITGIAYGAGIFVGVGGGGPIGGRIMTSSDATVWTDRAPSVSNAALSALATNGSTLVAVGSNGTLLSSSDGISWIANTNITTKSLNNIIFASGAFVAVGNLGVILTSPDGITWTQRASGISANILFIGHGNNIFVAGTDGAMVLTSVDGIVWNSNSAVSDYVSASISSIAYGNNTFVGVGSPSEHGRILTSTDGVFWTKRLGSASSPAWSSVTFANNIFVVVGKDDILTSPDGVNWTSQSVPTNGGLYDVTFVNGQFIAVGTSYWQLPNLINILPSAVFTSPDGRNWTRWTSPTYNGLQSVIGFGNKIVVVGSAGTILTSDIVSPRIAVEQPSSTGLTDSLSTVDFGHSLISVGTTRFCTIRNTGNAALAILDIHLDGADAGDFILSQPVTTTLAPGGNTTFSVTFTPTASGNRSAALHIISNVVGSENPFDLALMGVGGAAQTAMEAWRLRWFGTTTSAGDASDNADPHHTGVRNLAVFAFLGPNQNPSQATTSQLPEAQRSGGNLFYSFTQPAGVSGVTYSADWSTSLSSNDWHPVPDTGSGDQHLFSVPISDNSKLFLVLKVTNP